MGTISDCVTNLTMHVSRKNNKNRRSCCAKKEGDNRIRRDRAANAEIKFIQLTHIK